MRLPSLIAVSIGVAACGTDPVALTESDNAHVLDAPVLSAQGGAWVFNQGEGQPGPSGAGCHFGVHTTNQITVVHTPSGHVNVKCHFEGLPPIPEAETQRGWQCNWWIGGVLHRTWDSQWTRSPSGQATVTCKLKTQFPPPPKG